MRRKAIIISLSGYYLSQKEKNLMKEEKPWGIILFKRNIKSFTQLKNLTKSIKKTIKDKNYPILIDEEGGNVSRLSNLIDNKLFSQNFFGNLYYQNPNFTKRIYKKYIFSLSKILNDLSITINTVPVLDLTYKKTNKIIGSRSYSQKIKIVKNLGKLCIQYFRENKIFSVIKHIPGHGRATQDSHKYMPVINNNLKELLKSDFNCFINSKSFFAMTAHILYKKIDPQNVVTFSKIMIKNIIRKKLKFNGILISDDISMKALKYDLVTNAKKSLLAGCNLTLYCSGKYSESRKLLKEISYIDDFTNKKTSEFYKYLS